MNQDGVSVAFTLILEEITAVENQLSAEGGAAFREKRYAAADGLSAAGKQLLSFREKLEGLKAEWESGIELETRERVKVEPGYSIAPHTKGRKTTLRVTLKSGRVVQRPTAASTFADVIEQLGFESVRKLGLAVSGVPLIDIKRHDKYNQERRGPFFIATHSNTKTKKELLEQIGRRLGKPLSIETV